MRNYTQEIAAINTEIAVLQQQRSAIEHERATLEVPEILKDHKIQIITLRTPTTKNFGVYLLIFNEIAIVVSRDKNHHETEKGAFRVLIDGVPEELDIYLCVADIIPDEQFHAPEPEIVLMGGYTAMLWSKVYKTVPSVKYLVTCNFHKTRYDFYEGRRMGFYELRWILATENDHDLRSVSSRELPSSVCISRL